MKLKDIIETLRKGCENATKAEVKAAYEEQKTIASDLSYSVPERALAKNLHQFLNKELKKF